MFQLKLTSMDDHLFNYISVNSHFSTRLNYINQLVVRDYYD
jgi:hypothetical protein